jgi:hypothetical protein
MKTIRLVLAAIAFCGAVAGAFVSRANASLMLDVYGHTSGHARPQTLQT